jgi:osmotically-inducible protein OsmY
MSIQDDVSRKLAAELSGASEQIQVDVKGDEVTLAGTVDTADARTRAEEIAAGVSGVQYVLNNLRVRQPGGTGATG